VAGHARRAAALPHIIALFVFIFDGPALVWAALAIVAAIVEVSIPHFGVIFVTVSAAAAALVAVAGLGLAPQIVVFAVVLVLSLLLLRPRIMARLSARGVPSRTEALTGREGIVTHDIESLVGAGRVNVGGEDWAARAAVPLPAGTRVRVVGADGIVLEVTRA
jgi:membrane protein implicated in regulation of membrane protease activity